MKQFEKVFAFLFIFIILCGIIGTFPTDKTQAATQSSTEAEIARLEKDIEKWEKELAEYEKKVDQATKGAIYVIYGDIEIENPLIIRGGLTNLNIPYLHVTNYNITFTDALIGAIAGYFRELGTYTYEYKGQAVPDYEKVYAYEEERTALKNKISKAEEKLKKLKQDANAKFVLISDKKITIGKGQSFAVQYQMSENISDPTITWTSSDKTVATVSKNGVIKAKELGTAKITGKAKLNGKTITINVTVKEAISSISLKTKSITLAPGETGQLKKTVSPAKSYGVISWLCSDASVATVDENGLVTAVAPGTAYVYAYTDTKKVSNACKVTVKGDAVSYTKASSAAAAIAMVKASGYLENGVEYFFETSRGENKEYIITAYPSTGKYLDIVIGSSKKDKADIHHEAYYLKSGGKKVYFYIDAYDTDYHASESYSMLSGLAFETTQISLPQNAYQELILNADQPAQMDYIRITPENPEIAEVVFSADTGNVYVQGKNTGKTTITAESKNGQKTTLSVEVTGKAKTEAEVVAEAEAAWVQENVTREIKPGNKKYYEYMNEYLWWVNWYEADDFDKVELYRSEFEDELTYEEIYEDAIDFYGSLEAWNESIAESFSEMGMDEETVREKYEYYRNLYENGGEDFTAASNYQETSEYQDYIKKVKEEYREQQKGAKCTKPITAKTYQKNYKSKERYSNKKSVPFNSYYVLAEKDGNTLVIAGYDWFRLKSESVQDRFIK